MVELFLFIKTILNDSALFLTMTDYTISKLNMDDEGLLQLPHDLHLYTNLTHLSCRNNYLTMLDGVIFPPTLTHLFCGHNFLRSLDHLPEKLKVLDCEYNHLHSLHNLPSTLTHLYCNNNMLTSFYNIPPTLIHLVCDMNRLYSLDYLPPTLRLLFCEYNWLTSLESLPDTVNDPECFRCRGNPLPYDFLLNSPDTLKIIHEYNKQKKLYYKKIKPPVYKEELMQAVFHPDRVYNYLDKYEYHILVDEYDKQ